MCCLAQEPLPFGPEPSNLDSDPDSDPDSDRTLDPDPDPDPTLSSSAIGPVSASPPRT